MSNKSLSSRRKFLEQIGATGLFFASSPFASLATAEKAEERILRYEKKISPNDQIRIGLIGLGIQGNNDVRQALKVPGVQLVAAADLYKGRLSEPKKCMEGTFLLLRTTGLFWTARI